MRFKIGFAWLAVMSLAGCEDMSAEDMDTMANAMQTVSQAGNGDVYPDAAGTSDPDQALATALIQGTVSAAVTDGDAGEAFANGALQSLQNATAGGAPAGPRSSVAMNLPGSSDVPPGHDNLAADACPGFTDENYKSRALQGGPDAQLLTLCGGAFNYYHMYRRALEMGYTPDQAEVTYQAHRKAALVVTQFVRDSR